VRVVQDEAVPERGPLDAFLHAVRSRHAHASIARLTLDRLKL
jgi:hypothetical protein